VRMKSRHGILNSTSAIRRGLAAAILIAAAAIALPANLAAQDQDVLSPDQSSAKAKGILQQTIAGLGGPAYLNVKDITCEARLGQFGHSGELNGYAKIIDIAKPPFKDRTENLPKRNIITVSNGDKGWTLDRGGVSESTITDVATYQEDVKKDIDNVLRNRIHEPGMIFRYGGLDVVDYQEADWVELVDSENRTFRIAIARGTHLPIRKVVDTRDANTRMRSEEIEYYSNYHPIDGVQTPFQITRERNGIKIYQVFFDKFEINTGVADSLFTKESLEERWEKVGKKEKKPKEKPADKNNDKN
jgi:outer membrane lipoprotein-sorting protein